MVALTEFEAKRAEKPAGALVEQIRPPAHTRKSLDIAARADNQSVEVFEIRRVRSDPGESQELPIAKTTFVRTQSVWKVFWNRADLKWYRYDPAPEVATPELFFEIVKRDDDCCFWG